MAEKYVIFCLMKYISDDFNLLSSIPTVHSVHLYNVGLASAS